MSEEVVRWADESQYVAAPIKVTPEVHLLWATPDPLGAIAAICRMFEGKPTYNLSEITDEERHHYYKESFKSHLRAPHEFVQFHFYIEGVTRSHTHQAVRQRTATFAQESLRFAVKENLVEEVCLPPTIMAENDPAIDPASVIWHQTVKQIGAAYTALVNAGIPAEDARGLLPHAVATRLHYRTNLNDLIHHAGNRLCTQAQFEWRHVMVGIMKAISGYSTGKMMGYQYRQDDSWQFELLGSPMAQTFSPICYKTGKCEFEAIFDRDCTIRSRVKAFSKAGISSDRWDKLNAVLAPDPPLDRIKPHEWLADPAAARSGDANKSPD